MRSPFFPLFLTLLLFSFQSMIDNESIEEIKSMKNGSCYARVISLAKKLRKKLEKLKKMKISNSVSPPPSCPLPPLPNALSVKHVQKKKSWKDFFRRTYQLGPLMVTRQRASEKSPGFYIAKLNGRQLTILKLYITTDFRYGLTFSCHKVSRNQRKKDSKRLCSFSDECIQSALYIWFQETVYPPIQTASDMLRDGLKIYLIYP